MHEVFVNGKHTSLLNKESMTTERVFKNVDLQERDVKHDDRRHTKHRRSDLRRASVADQNHGDGKVAAKQSYGDEYRVSH